MTLDWTPEHFARLEEVNLRYSAGLIRHILETAVQPRIGSMLAATLDGNPVPGCTHLIGGVPGAEFGMGEGQLGVLDWRCQGVGLLCHQCAERHLSDPATPHRDQRHECCIVCGFQSDQGSNPLVATIKLRKPLAVASPELDAISALTGQPLARGLLGGMVTSPIAWECPAHDGFLDSKITFVWPPRGSGLDPMKPKGKGGKGKKGGRNRR